MAAALTVSFTFPAPVTATVTVAPPEVNSASTDSAAAIPTTQLTLLLLRQAGLDPLQPKNTEPPPAAEASVTIVPAGKLDAHVPLAVAPVSVQAIPAGRSEERRV